MIWKRCKMKFKVGDVVKNQQEMFMAYCCPHGSVVWVGRATYGPATIEVRWVDGRTTFSYGSNLEKIEG